MNINKNFIALFSILLLVISVLHYIYNKSEKLYQEIESSEDKVRAYMHINGEKFIVNFIE